ncbi:hypothetical protein E1B28_003260 [Marasmius oreades]|uniref:BTB domain-containing protein n=1 Tax=Marasmius oreades TaxID=181124 RepID=A0A9P7RM35_9AGAR|nr:uncharacterized protein E1B28_003260 [Marasmius oreades]KAG7085716.1 hypothetical protein E1B28_003260 [Marasmius oreades]
MACNVATGCELERTASWLILSGDFSSQAASATLSKRIGFDVTKALYNNKLLPKMALAIQSGPTRVYDRGRLFTFLPLPISTAFPLHVHGLFSLTQSRQNLRNVGEKKGVAEGSNDHVLLEWNNLMFNFYLPKLWTRLFQVLSDCNTSPSLVLQAWPNLQPDVKCGDSLNWKDLPRKLADEVVLGNCSVWPVADSRGVVNHLSLKEVFLLSENAKPLSPMLPILATSGINVSKIPAHLYDLLSVLHREHAHISFLEPCSLARRLRVCVPARIMIFDDTNCRDAVMQEYPHKLTSLSSPDKVSLLEYLLSGNQLQNIEGLPLVPLPGNQYATLSLCSSFQSKRTLLSEADFEVFKSLDGDAIALHILPESVARLLQAEGPKQLNVQSLDNARVVHYLGSSQALRPCAWIVQFWSWVTRYWKDRDGLFVCVQRSNLQIIPCTDSIMRRTSDIVFQSPGNPKLEVAFRKLNISFVSRELPSSVMDFLIEKGCLKDLHNVETLLDNVRAPLSLDLKESATVLEHFLERPYLRLSTKHLSKLYRLPIFPLLKPLRSGIVRVVSGLSDEVKGIKKESTLVVINNSLLPPVTNVSFLDLSPPNDNLLLLLSPLRQPLTVSDLLKLSLDNFQSQPVHFQSAMVRYMANNVRSISPDTIDRLKNIAFLPNRAGILRAPADLIDPSSPIAKLYLPEPDSEWLPSKSRNDGPLVDEIINLGLLQKTLSTRVVDERIKYITSTNDNAILARSLLDLIKSENFDCSCVHIDPEAKWLPGDSGLSSTNRSRDPAMYALGRELFDEVLDVVEFVPRRLRERVGWGSPIPFSILLQQFERIVLGRNANKIGIVIKEFSSRLLKAWEFDKLKNVVGDEPWIPISGRRADELFLVPTSRAVLGTSRGDSPPFGFHELPSDPSRQKFFRAMGCLERPSPTALISSLHDLAKQGIDYQSKLQKIATLLEALADEKLSDEERAKVLVPDSIGTLHPIHRIVYKDISCPVLLPPDLRLAHSSIQLDLAKKLQISFLGHRQLGHIQNLADSGMEETFKTKIRKTLRHYTDQQLLTEMLANALDAGASKFTVLVDEFQPPRPELSLLSHSMAQFYSGPSLVVYNNAVFKDEDFNNVINGIGGKHDRTDTIGQFALGALTMFHVTDMPMVISGDKILFLDSSDPDERHLSMLGNGPATILDWRRVASTYPDHFASLEGLFGFSTEFDRYNATLFRLPLKKSLTSSGVMRDLIKPFQDRVEQCVLFTGIKSIEVLHRRDGDPQICFAVVAGRQIDHDDGNFVSQQLTVSTKIKFREGGFGSREDRWRVVLGNDLEPLPERYNSMHQTHRIRSPILIGLAAHVAESPKHPKNTKESLRIKSLFYSLPLPVSTTLPVHLTAPFILSEDRRNIRFESNYNKQEASYNQWLLSELVPPLYFFLLEELTLRYRDPNAVNATWWPGQSDDNKDPIADMVTGSFFAKLPSTTRRIFMTSGPSPKTLTPQEAIVSGREPSVVTELLSKLETPDLVKFDSKADSHLLYRLCTVLQTVDGGLLRSEILRATPTFILWYDSRRSSARKISCLETLTRFISSSTTTKTDFPSLLKDLPLIPLLDGTLGCFGDCSTSQRKYYYSFDPSCSRILPANRLVDPDFNLCVQLSQKGLNVLELEPKAVRDLLHGRIPEHEEGKCSVTVAEASLIRIFWEVYNELPKDTIKELTSFSLLPITGGFYLSIAYTRHPSVIFAAPGDETWLLECATVLGALVIKREDIKALPYDYIPEKGPLFRALWAFFQQSNLSTLHFKFVTLDPHLWSRFAEWCRRCLRDDYHDVYKRDKSSWSIVKNLPIWEVHTPTTITLDSVVGVSMLSSTIHSTPEIINFMRNFMNVKFTPFSGVLRRMEHSEVDRDNLLSRLQLPHILNPGDIEPYKSLLRLVLQGNYSGLILLPNDENRVMTATAFLCAHDPLFLAAFPDDRFCHEQFKEFESRLQKHGLKVRQDLSVSLFTECAQAFHANLRNDPGTRMDRAHTLFRTFCEDLPLHAGSRPLWGGLDSLRFIPSANERGQRSRWRNRITQHPTIASPREVIRDDLAGIAWSQRAFFATSPHQRILLAHPNLGVPTVSEVVAHLQILAGCGATCSSDTELLQDLTETYRWLDQHSDEAEVSMINHHDRPLFLNVDDPEMDIWTGNWIEADRLFFNLRCDTGTIRRVRRFLSDFPSLLRGSGVKELQDVQAPNISSSTNETILERQRNRFEEMRTKNELVDIKFVSSDTDEFWAHRSFLAAASDHFRLSFCTSGMEESRPASTSDPVVVLMTAYNAETVKSVLDYIYTGALPEVTRSDGMDADADTEGDALGRWFSIINLAQLWEVWDLFEDVQKQMIEEWMINPYTVDEIQKHAMELNANHLVSACEEYVRSNKEALRNLPGLDN